MYNKRHNYIIYYYSIPICSMILQNEQDKFYFIFPYYRAREQPDTHIKVGDAKYENPSEKIFNTLVT